MNYVQPKRIPSPWTGTLSSPQIKERDYGDYILKEAWWYCPDSGQFITKGIVERIDKKKSDKKHDWWTKVRKRRSDADKAKKESIGTVVHHTLNEQGEVHFYDVQWEDRIEKGIPAGELVMVEGRKHKH